MRWGLVLLLLIFIFSLLSQNYILFIIASIVYIAVKIRRAEED